MNIVGVLVQAKPESSEQVAASLAQTPGVAIHARTEDHRFVVTIEDLDGVSVPQTLIGLYSVPGVLSAILTYQHNEPENDLTAVAYQD